MKLKTAILFLVFNRPDPTREVFEAIRTSRPPRLYIAADGPRGDRSGEVERCAQVRDIVGGVDWACDVKTLFRGSNMGCKRAVSEGISWFFEHEPEGIILEDDCLPSSSFFTFCEELLERYRDDTRVWQICGTNLIGTALASATEASYRFSKYGPIWGWASWRRAWKNYDPDLSEWPAMSRPEAMESAYSTPAERKARLMLGTKLFDGAIDTWDYQWGFAKNFNYALSIVPAQNLIRNIGFGPDATHTTGEDKLAPKELHTLSFPLRHPKFIMPDARHDDFHSSHIFVGTLGSRARRVVSGLLRSVSFGRIG
jgi:hypothetical protein